MNSQIQQAFEDIGAEVLVATVGDVFEIDVLRREKREVYQLKRPLADSIALEAIDVRPRQRHLVLDVSGWRLPISGRYLCGHDEFHWFVASLPINRRTATVRGAMEALKPDAVLRDQRRMGVRHRRHRRKTAVYVRQGEWFFLPRPKLSVDERLVVRHGLLARPGGKPHRVEWLYRSADGEQTFALGDVSHPDHNTIHLEVWHRVLQNNEAEPAPAARPVTRMAFLD